MISPLWIPLAGTAIVPVTVIGAILARAWARRVNAPPQIAPVNAELLVRMERMEQAIDSIAVEIERISEGQRFTTRLLAGRGDAGDAPPAIPGGLPS
jgi:hypothetical protein